MRNEEYIVYKNIAQYMGLQYPKVLYHFDQAGLNLSKAQAGMMKAIQCDRGFPDFQVFVANECYNGLFIEVKKDGVKLTKKSGDWVNEHVAEQAEMIEKLIKLGYHAQFCIGFDECKECIDWYMNLK